MANEPTGFLCYNNQDLIRDGFIWPFLIREHLPKDFPMHRLSVDRKGITYVVEKDESGKITKIIERRKQLPASKVKAEILFSKQVRNVLENPITPEFLAGFGGIGGGAIWNVGQGYFLLVWED